jgi:uncharacterized protein YndB with AHSA1/START domain
MTTAGRAGATTFTTPSDREILGTRVVDAPRELVWEAWTSPEHLLPWLLGPERWTMPSKTVQSVLSASPSLSRPAHR